MVQLKTDAGLNGTFPVIDGHVDLIYHMMRFSPTSPFPFLNSGPLTRESLQMGNVRIIVAAFYCADAYNGSATSNEHLSELYAFGQKMLEGLSPVISREDLATAYDTDGSPGILYLLENADALVDSDIEFWKARGFHAVGLTHVGKNRIGSGNLVIYPSGFTSEGRRVISALDHLGMAVDVAHLSEPCFEELIDLFSGSLLSSHTGFRRFCDLPRNLSDFQVRALIERGGIIGVSVNPEMLSAKAKVGIADIFEQIDWLVQRYGDQQVAIGSDFGGFDMPAEGVTGPGNFPTLCQMMLERGYPVSAVSNIMGNNWYRFYDALLPNRELDAPTTPP